MIRSFRSGSVYRFRKDGSSPPRISTIAKAALKSIATFNVIAIARPDAKVAVYPYKRMFQVALVDEDLTTGGTSVVYMPGSKSSDHECWYIDMGIVDNAFMTPDALARTGSM